jgi:exopolysaccharide biosynthesis polyprenyl glycosylphosphotransferase
LETRAQRALRSLVLSLDALLILAALAFAVLLHPLLRDLVPLLQATPTFDAVARLAVVVVPVWLVLIAFLQLDRTYERLWSRFDLLFGLLKLHLAGFLALSAILFVTQIVINRSLILTFLASSFVLLYAERGLLSRWHRWQHAQGQVPDRLLLVGDPTYDMLEFVKVVTRQPLRPRLVGLVSASHDVLPTLPPRIGDVEQLDEILRHEAVDAVVFFPPYQSATRAAEQLAVCETVGAPAHFAVELGRPNQAEPRVLTLYDRPFITYEVAPKNAAALAIKHGLDLVVAAVATVVLSPVLLVASLAILVTMGRPLFFVQERAGLRGRRFRMYKFRTMVRDAEKQRGALESANEMTGPVFKIARDPRVTRLGRFLRRTSIDELPQLFNVLAGSMSIVGPRPLPVKEQQEIRGWHRRRLMMKPGLTCLWQISGRNQIGFDDWMKLDLRYIDEWSLTLDLVIVLKTVPAVLLGRGAR